MLKSLGCIDAEIAGIKFAYFWKYFSFFRNSTISLTPLVSAHDNSQQSLTVYKQTKLLMAEIWTFLQQR